MRPNTIAALASLSLALALFQGCAHGDGGASTDARLDEKLAARSNIKSSADLHKESGRLIETARGLSDQQRADLKALRSSVYSQVEKVRDDSLRLRALLVREVISKNFDPEEVDRIKTRLKDLEQKRLSILFGAVRDANLIFGRWTSRNDRTSSDVLEDMTWDMFEDY